MMHAALDANASNAAMRNELTPLQYATIHGYSCCAELLLLYKADHACVDDQGNTLAHLAVMYNQGHLLLLFHDKQIGLSVPNHRDETALHWAACRGNLPLVQALVECAATIEAVDSTGKTPLHAAIVADHSEVVSYLISVGADATKKTSGGSTCLHLVRSPAVAALLLDQGLLIEPDEQGWTPLHHAAYHGLLAVMKLLLSHGADLQAVDAKGVTVYTAALTGGYQDAVRDLLVADW